MYYFMYSGYLLSTATLMGLASPQTDGAQDQLNRRQLY